jgi:hypothetical protein
LTDESTGELGGYGFNDYALPIIIEGPTNCMRDPETLEQRVQRSPGGLPQGRRFSATWWRPSATSART